MELETQLFLSLATEEIKTKSKDLKYLLNITQLCLWFHIRRIQYVPRFWIFINKYGLAVSNYHVFKGTGIGEEGIKLAGDDKTYKVAEVIKSSEKEDFILFRVNASNTNFIPIAKYKPNVGEKVYAIGSPRGLENTFSSGEISQWRDKNLMQISALIDHGSSGGALINEYGEAVGITSGTFVDGSQANLNYAWSIDVIKPYIKSK